MRKINEEKRIQAEKETEERMKKTVREETLKWLSDHNISLAIFIDEISDQMRTVHDRYNRLTNDNSFNVKRNTLNEKKKEFGNISNEYKQIQERKGLMANEAEKRLSILNKANDELDTQIMVLEYLEDHRIKTVKTIDGCLKDIVKDFEDYFRMKTLDTRMGKTISDSETEKFFRRIEEEAFDVKNTLDQCDLRIMLFTKSLSNDQSSIDQLEEDLAGKESKDMARLVTEAKKNRDKEKQVQLMVDEFVVSGMGEKTAQSAARLVVFGNYPKGDVKDMFFAKRSNVKDILQLLDRRLEAEKDCYTKSTIYQIIKDLSRDVSDVEQVERLVKVQRHE